MLQNLVILKDDELELDFKRQPYSCFVDNYFDVGLTVPLANVDF